MLVEINKYVVSRHWPSPWQCYEIKDPTKYVVGFTPEEALTEFLRWEELEYWGFNG